MPSLFRQAFLGHGAVRIARLSGEESRHRVQGAGQRAARFTADAVPETDAHGRQHRRGPRVQIEHVAGRPSGDQRIKDAGMCSCGCVGYVAFVFVFVNCVCATDPA